MATKNAKNKQAAIAKYAAHKQDAVNLLDFIAGCIENHPSAPAHDDQVNWGDVGNMAHLREQLMEIATGFAMGADLSEESTRNRLEAALQDDSPSEALIETID